MKLLWVARRLLLVGFGPDLVVCRRVERCSVYHLLLRRIRLLHWNKHGVATDWILVNHALAIWSSTSSANDYLGSLVLGVHRSFHAVWLLDVLHVEVRIFLWWVLVAVRLLLMFHCDRRCTFVAISVAWHRCLNPSLVIQLGSWIVLVLFHNSLFDIRLWDHLMILQRSQLVQVVTLDLVVWVVISLVYLYVSDCVRVIDHRRRSWVQIDVTLLQFLELLKLIVSWEGEHIHDRLNLLSYLQGVIDRLSRLYLHLLLLLVHHERAPSSWLTVRSPFISKSNCTLPTILHRVSLLAIQVTAYVVDVEIGPRR